MCIRDRQYNLRYADRLAMFEIGRAYLPERGEGALPHEDRRLSLVLTGPRQPLSFYNSNTENSSTGALDFYDLKGVVETLLARLGFKADAIEYRGCLLYTSSSAGLRGHAAAHARRRHYAGHRSFVSRWRCRCCTRAAP